MMRMDSSIAGLLALAMVWIPGGTAQGSGFQLREQSGEGMGNAYAGSAAKAADVDTAFSNPAGMTRLHGNQAGASAAVIAPRSSFESSAGEIQGFYHPVAVGAAYAMWDATPDWRLGVALTMPFGMRVDYPDDWVGRYQALDNAITNVNVSPALAYRWNERWSVAAGVQMGWTEARLTNAVNFGALVPGSGDGQFRVDGSDLGWGWTASALYEASAATRLGLSYRSSVRHNVRGDAEFQGVPDALAGDAAFADGGVVAKLALPDTATLSLYHEVTPEWALMADLSWTNWSLFRTLRLSFDNARPDSVQPQNWRDSWFYAVGATWRRDEDLALQVGAAYDSSPVETTFRNARIPDGDRLWLSAGLTYAVAPGQRVSLSYAHLFLESVLVDQTDPSGLGGRLQGRFGGHVDIVSVQYTVRF